MVVTWSVDSLTVGPKPLYVDSHTHVVTSQVSCEEIGQRCVVTCHVCFHEEGRAARVWRHLVKSKTQLSVQRCVCVCVSV